MRLVYVDIDRCLGCFSCERACSLKQYHDHKGAQSNIHVLVDIVRRAIRTSTCLQCRRPLCEAACPTQALHKDPITNILVVDREVCIGCEACKEICPVDAVNMVKEKAEVDLDWCIGCGVCSVSCPAGAISIKRRSEARSPENFADLHKRIRLERGLT